MQVASYSVKGESGFKVLSKQLKDKIDIIIPKNNIDNTIGLRKYSYGTKGMVINNTNSITTRGMGGDLHLYNLNSGEYQYATPNNFYTFKKKGNILELPVKKSEMGNLQTTPFSTLPPRFNFSSLNSNTIKAPKMDLSMKPTGTLNTAPSGGMSSGMSAGIGMVGSFASNLIPSNVKAPDASKFADGRDYAKAMEKVGKQQAGENLQKQAEQMALSSGNPYAMAGAAVSMVGRTAEGLVGSTTDEYGIEEYGKDAALKKTVKDVINPVGNMTEFLSDPSLKSGIKAFTGPVGAIAVNAFGMGKKKDKRERNKLIKKQNAKALMGANQASAMMYTKQGGVMKLQMGRELNYKFQKAKDIYEPITKYQSPNLNQINSIESLEKLYKNEPVGPIKGTDLVKTKSGGIYSNPGIKLSESPIDWGLFGLTKPTGLLEPLANKYIKNKALQQAIGFLDPTSMGDLRGVVTTGKKALTKKPIQKTPITFENAYIKEAHQKALGDYENPEFLKRVENFTTPIKAKKYVEKTKKIMGESDPVFDEKRLLEGAFGAYAPRKNPKEIAQKILINPELKDKSVGELLSLMKHEVGHIKEEYLPKDILEKIDVYRKDILQNVSGQLHEYQYSLPEFMAVIPEIRQIIKDKTGKEFWETVTKEDLLTALRGESGTKPAYAILGVAKKQKLADFMNKMFAVSPIAAGSLWINDAESKKQGGLIKAKNGALLAPDEAFLPIGARHHRKHNIKKYESITNKGIPVGMQKGGEFEQTAEIETCELTLGEEFNELYTNYTSAPSDELLITIGKKLHTAVKEMGKKGFKSCKL